MGVPALWRELDTVNRQLARAEAERESLMLRRGRVFRALLEAGVMQKDIAARCGLTASAVLFAVRSSREKDGAA